MPEASSVNTNAPPASVTTERFTTRPSTSVPVSSMVTPAMPFSPVSIRPLLFRSNQTRPRSSALLGISAKLLPVLLTPTPRMMPLIALGSVVIGVAVPPALPAMVWPLVVSSGWVGSVIV